MLLKVLFFYLMYYVHIGFISCLNKLLLHNYLGNVGLKNAFLSRVSASRLEKLFRFSKSRQFGIVMTKLFFL